MKIKILFTAFVISALFLSCEKKDATPNYTAWGIKEEGNVSEIHNYLSQKSVIKIINKNDKTWLFSLAPCDTCEVLPFQCRLPQISFITQITNNQYYSLATQLYFSNLELNASGEAFICEGNKILKINTNSTIQTYITLPAETDISTDKTYITNYKIDSQNNIWIGTNNGLFRWDNEKLLHYHSGNTIFHDNHVNKIEIDANNKIWVLTNQEMAGFYILENEKWSYMALENVKNSYNSTMISYFLIDKNSHLWAHIHYSNNYSIIKYNGSEWRDCSLNPDNDFSNQLIADSEGRIWLIRRIHAEQIQDRTEQLFFYENNQWNEVDISDIEYRVLSVDVKDNKILLGLSQGYVTVDYAF